MAHVPHPELDVSSATVDEAVRYLASVSDARMLMATFAGDIWTVIVYYHAHQIKVEHKYLDFAFRGVIKRMREIDSE